MPIIKRIGDNRLVKEITNAEHTTPSLTNLQTQTDQIPQKLTTEDAFEDYVVSGFSGDGTGSGLELTLTTGAAYVDGYRVSRVSSEFDMTHTYTASKDTYVDIDSDGELSYIETALGAGEPTLDAGKIRLIKVVTDGTDITGVTDLRDTTLTINRDIMFISEKEIVTISDTQTLTNKTLTTPKANVIDEETSDTGVTVDGCLIKDGIVSDSNKLEGKSLIESINWIRPELVGSGLSISGINIQALTSLNGT
ncbi:MAG: hypothetical protein KAS32_04690, partial [Candidatus Peribacteraceae bacterium]|nr:hypothetical protein [Candidatus Peribacteraceae bacterium]